MEKISGISFSGKVVHGHKIGRKLGFPTANLEVDNVVLNDLRDGVYAVKILFENEQYNGMLNLGKRPTFGDNKRSVEVHILNFDEEIYDKNLQIIIVGFIRPQQKFDSLEALKSQIEADKSERQKFEKEVNN